MRRRLAGYIFDLRLSISKITWWLRLRSRANQLANPV